MREVYRPTMASRVGHNRSGWDTQAGRRPCLLDSDSDDAGGAAWLHFAPACLIERHAAHS